MRFITFKSLEGKNFLSFGDELIKITLHQGVNTIVGTNYDKEDSKNGAGKSSITELLYYCLYGTTLREIPKDNIQNSITNKKTEASLTFDVESNGVLDSYTITRKLNPTKCQIFKNEEEITRSTLAKTNELIQSIIRTSSTIFQNSVIMVANSTLPFMAMSKVDKRKFIESILGLEAFSEMVLRARDEYNSTKKEYELQYSLLEQFQSELNFNNNQFLNYESLKEDKINNLNNKIKKIKEETTTLEGQLSAPSEQTNCLDEQLIELNLHIAEAQEKQSSLTTKQIKAESELKNILKQIEKINANKDQCPTCLRDYSEEHIAHAEDTLSKLTTNRNLFEQAILKLIKELTSIKQGLKTSQQIKLETEQQIKIRDNIKTSNDIILAKLEHLKRNQEDLNVEMEKINVEQNDPLQQKIAELTNNITIKNELVAKLNNDLNVLESVKFVLSEEGIKSFIVKKILTILNSRLAFYLKKLEANCLCKFNEFFEEEIIDEKGKQKSYFNFSGGEKKRIDIACLFAFADIRRLQGDVNFSTIFYDELFDSSLDDRGVALTVKVLQDRFNEYKESCYIITHRGVHGTFKSNHTIHVIKRNGVSSICNDSSDRYLN